MLDLALELSLSAGLGGASNLPLPTLPLAAGARLVAIGDSQVARANYTIYPNTGPTTSKAIDTLPYSPIIQAQGINPRFKFENWYDPTDVYGRNMSPADLGIPGDHFAAMSPPPVYGISNRISAVSARRAQFALYNGGTNPINSGDDGSNIPATADYVISCWQRDTAALRRAGLPTVFMLIFPRDDWPALDARYQTILDCNTWARNNLSTANGVYILDGWDVLAPGGVIDTSLFTPEPVSGVHIHLNQRGAYAMALKLNTLLDSIVGSGSIFVQDPTVGNLFGSSVGNLTGTTGSKVGGGGGTTGSVATGCSARISRGTSSSQVMTKETISGALTRQVATITIVADANTYNTSLFTVAQITTGLPVAGDWIQGYIYCELNASDELIANQRLRVWGLDASTATVVSAYAQSGFTTDFTTPFQANRGYWLITNPIQIPAGVTLASLNMTVESFFPSGSNASTSYKLSRPKIAVLSDPRAAWGM